MVNVCHGFLMWLHSFKTALPADQASIAWALVSLPEKWAGPESEEGKVSEQLPTESSWGNFLNIAVSELGIRDTWRGKRRVVHIYKEPTGFTHTPPPPPLPPPPRISLKR